jgi:hypothetical protein
MKREQINARSEARSLGIVIEEIAEMGVAEPAGN